MKEQNRNLWIFAILVIFCLFHAPTILLGGDAYYNAFDTLDSYVAWYRVVINGGYASAPPFEVVQPFMNGVPKFTLVSTYNLYYWLNLAFSTFHAYQILTLLISVIAFVGMWLLSKKYLGLSKVESGFLALSFAFTPFLQTWVFSIAGQPLLLYVILNIRNGDRSCWNWAVVLLFPFTSNFQSAGVFILFLLGIFILIDKYKKRRVFDLVAVFVILSLVFVLTKFDLIENIFQGKGFVSHRTEMLRYSLPISTCLIVMVRYFLLGNIDVALSLHTYILLPFTLIVFFWHVLTKKQLPKNLFWTLTIISVICIYVGLLQWEPIVSLRNGSGFLRMYSVERFHIFLQLLWHIAVAQAFLLLPMERRSWIAGIVIVGQIILSFAYLPTYYAGFFYKIIKIQPYHYIYRYDEYYAEKMFSEINAYINKPQNTYRVGSIGIPPAISQYNGFWTIDGYSSNYPLSYKHDFRKIIQNELDKNPSNKGFFDHWGSQCIILYDQGAGFFDTQMTRDKTPALRDIRLSYEGMQSLNCQYILSTETIEHPEKSGLIELATFSSSIWKVTLYQLVKADLRTKN